MMFNDELEYETQALQRKGTALTNPLELIIAKAQRRASLTCVLEDEAGPDSWR